MGWGGERASIRTYGFLLKGEVVNATLLLVIEDASVLYYAIPIMLTIILVGK